MNSRFLLGPMRAPHMARSTTVEDNRASERQDASDVQIPSPMQSMTDDSDKAATGDSKD